jgi:hypothetical protein
MYLICFWFHLSQHWPLFFHSLHSVALQSQQGVKLQKQHASLLEEHRRLEEETSSALSPDEMRERLMAKVKEDTAFIESAQRKLEQMDALIGNLGDQVRAKQQQLKDGQVPIEMFLQVSSQQS